MEGNRRQGQLTEIQQLKQEIDALKSLCNQKIAENENLSKSLIAIEWMLTPKQKASIGFVPDYGDLSDLNEDGLIKKSIQKQQLQDIVSEYLDLLETSAAIYEKNGDYALGIFSSGWCRMMDAASRKLCNTDDNREALESGKWLCHDSCWKDTSLKAMAEGNPVEVACNGGIYLYAVPVRANNQIIGAINFGFGSPPKDDAELKKLSKKYKIPLAELRKQSNNYTDRPQFVIDYAKQRIEKSAQHVGYLVERQKIDQSLRRTQKTVDKSPLSVFWVSPEGKFIYVNETAAKKLKYSREELLSMHVWDIDPNYPRETREKQFSLHREHGDRVIESVHRRSDGAVFPVKINAHVLTFEGQEMEIAEVEDVTKRKQADNQLKESEERYRSLVDAINSGVAVYKVINDGTSGFDYIIQEFNQFALKHEQLKKDEVVGKSLKDIRPNIDEYGLIDIFRNVWKTGESINFPAKVYIDEKYSNYYENTVFKLPSGEIVAVYDDVTVREIAEKTKQVLFQIANEILSNFKLEDFIRAIEKQLSQIVDTTNFYIALYDSESGMLSAPFEKDQKDSIESWPSKGSATGLVIEEKQSVLLNKQDVLTLIESGKIKQTGSICESWLGVPLFRGTDVTGVIVVQSYSNPDAYDSGTVKVFEYVSNQISLALERTKIFEDLLQAKNRAEESDRLKSAFLANMSHEIRTPMNGILGFAELLKEPQLTDEQQQKYIGIIQKSGERMLNIINDIVDISRIESGMMDVALDDTNINEQLDYIYTFFKPQVEAKGMQLTLLDLPPEEAAITVTDREKLYAILTNLVKNAIKYTHEGTIGFGCNFVETHDRAYLQFFVRDTGIGIPKDRQHAIFERFIQADVEDREARQGAGLGLAISKAYVDMLGGEIWVESDKGKGSTFYFTIPYQKEHQEAEKEKTVTKGGKNDFNSIAENQPDHD